MKAIKTISVILTCLLLVSFQNNAANLKGGSNDYKIEEVDNPGQLKNAEKVWNLTYDGSDRPVTVVKRKNSDCVFYVVNTDFFEVCYACTPKGFGVGTVKKSWSSVPFQINQAVLNPDGMKKQKVIVPEKVSDEKALGLIASYLPELLNDEYKHLLN